MVAPAGLEPARPKASDFKSLASTDSATGPASGQYACLFASRNSKLAIRRIL